MHVDRIAEKPRVTAPFSDDAWAAFPTISAAGSTRISSGNDVRSPWAANRPSSHRDDYQSAEWNTAAVGPEQTRQGCRRSDPLPARDLPRRLLPLRPGKGGIRRELKVQSSRSIGARDASRFGDPSLVAFRPGAHATAEQSLASPRASPSVSTSAAHYVIPAYEDPAQLLVQEANLPSISTPPTQAR